MSDPKPYEKTTRVAVAICGLLLSLAPALADVGTTFTYQGLLTENGNPVTGIYEFHFAATTLD